MVQGVQDTQDAQRDHSAGYVQSAHEDQSSRSTQGVQDEQIFQSGQEDQSSRSTQGAQDEQIFQSVQGVQVTQSTQEDGDAKGMPSTQEDQDTKGTQRAQEDQDAKCTQSAQEDQDGTQRAQEDQQDTKGTQSAYEDQDDKGTQNAYEDQDPGGFQSAQDDQDTIGTGQSDRADALVAVIINEEPGEQKYQPEFTVLAGGGANEATDYNNYAKTAANPDEVKGTAVCATCVVSLEGAEDSVGLPQPFVRPWLRVVLSALLWVLGVLLIRPLVWLLSLRARKLLPRINSPILTMRARDLAEAIRSRKLRAEEVVSAYVTRIQEVNPALNAVVDQRFAEALEDARQIDASLDRGELKDLPLIGVPITVKESIAVKGLSFRGGKPLAPGEERCAAEDSPSVQRLRAAGAVPLCVTNTPELCLWWESYNSTTGYTANPYDTRLTSGGSSGGEGALLGSAASILGLGSDVAGSCRLPAFYCGVSAHKPTPAVVPWTGHAPGSGDPKWTDYFTQAPMARHVSDLPLALQVLAGDKAPLLRLTEKVDLKKVRVFYVESEPRASPAHQVSEEVRSGIRRAAEHLRSRGLSVQQLDIPGLEDAIAMSTLMLVQVKRLELPHYNPEHPDKLFGVWSELFRFMVGCSPHTLHSLLAGVLFHVSRPFFHKAAFRNAERLQQQMRAFFKETLGEDGVLLYPPMPEPAHLRHGIWHKVLDATYFMLFNALSLPVTQVPLGLGTSGRPIGVQVAANKYQDRLTLAIGQELEEALGGWVPPPCKE